MRRPSRGLCWSAPISADSACNIGEAIAPNAIMGWTVFQPGENSGPGSGISWRPGELAQPPAIREQSPQRNIREDSLLIGRTKPAKRNMLEIIPRAGQQAC
jgi:hypothetical protein